MADSTFILELTSIDIFLISPLEMHVVDIY